MKSPVIEFNEEKHIYTVDGKRMASVTQICGLLKDLGHIPQEVLKKAGDRGKHVHALTELLDLGKLSITPIPNEWLNGMLYIKGYQKYRKEHKEFKIIEVETEVLSLEHRYIGRLDRVYKYNTEYRIGDIKSNARPSWTWGVQLAAYQRAKNELNNINWPKNNKVPITGRIIIHLDKIGGYNIIDESSVITLKQLRGATPETLRYGFMLPYDTCIELFDWCKSIYEVRQELKNLEDLIPWKRK